MAKELQAFKYARTILERLDELIIINKYSEEIESLSMTMKAKPFKDDDELMPLCYRCSHHNPLMNPKGNNCSNCSQSFVFSFASFESLPLVEFIIPDEISDEEAFALIDYVPNSQFEKDAEIRQREAAQASGLLTARSSLNHYTDQNKMKINLIIYKIATNRLVIGEDPAPQASNKDPFVALMNKYSVIFYLN